jgi:S-adenosylmethionine decarboxylase
MLLGRQFTLTLEQCSPLFVDDPDQVIQAVDRVAVESKLTVLKAVEHRFAPQGLTYILVLSQSHLVVHTWPEYRIIVVDVFVCVPDFDIDFLTQRLVAVSGAARVEKTCVFDR